MVKPLTVYKASAGSGKTFTLATEYIKLLIDNPLSYRQILAVTFTNKATEEMKTRILSQLYGISHRLDDSQRYIDKIHLDTGLSPDHIRRQAGLALHLLLHNYNYFRVETIDSFFQSVLRNLARELDLTANLRIGLNDTQVEELAVDRLVDSLTTTDLVLQWLLHYIMESISDDRSWNVISRIKTFGRTIFRDYYKQESKALNTVLQGKNFFADYTSALRTIRRDAEDHMRSIADEFFQTIESAGLTTDDFSNKSRGVCSIFIKLRRGDFDSTIVNDTVRAALCDPAKWYTKKSPNASLIHSLVETTLAPLLQRAVDAQPVQWRLFKSADLTLAHLSQVRLLSSIEQQVRQLNQESNRFLLSDTQQLLHDLIEGSDSPFIFEKIGTRLEHIMIDEFQDTSTVQWQNFKVLLQETMSHHNSRNLIVGDVKQSIYRWRSGDWRLLAAIDDEFDNADSLITHRTLDTNYRSKRRIIDFNNAFFLRAADIEGIEAYTDVTQQVPANRPDEGYVEVQLLPADDDYESSMLQLLADRVRQMSLQGIPLSDMAILVRTNNHIPVIARYFMEHIPDISVVSDEAFRLDASPAVRAIILALRALTHPDDTIARAALSKISSGSPNGPLPDAFTPQLLQLPLYELAEHIYSLFRLDTMPGQSAYLCAFYDYLLSFITDNTSDIDSFLHEWDSTIASKTIQSPAVNGLRIISIHKSKGLEFPYVFIPYCDWNLEHRGEVLWCKPGEAPFNRLPIVPVDYSEKGMQGTIYESDYTLEHMQTTVDNLNLLYVAFTRASAGLYVYGKRGNQSLRSALILQTLPQIVPLLNGSTLSCDDDASPLVFTYGTPDATASADHKSSSSNPFIQEPTPLAVDIVADYHQPEFRQSNRSRDFCATPEYPENPEIPDNPDDPKRPIPPATLATPDYIHIGSVLHELFSTIRTTADIDAAIRQMELDGILFTDTISRTRLESLVRKRLNDPRVARWFSPGWTLFNECTILSTDPATGTVVERRPDRVMTNDSGETIVVDFKFGSPRDEYHQQVRQYMTLLTNMGYPSVKGYLWFVYSNKIVEVK